MTTGGRDGRTRRRLLDAATRLFAERGFKHVTVRALCHEARANVAAVNYHFGDKAGLYREVLEEAAVVVVQLSQEVIEAGQGLPPEGRLRAYIRVHCQYFHRSGQTTRLQQLMQRELQEPTKALASVIERVWKPRFDYLAVIVGERLGLAPDDERVVRSAISIHGQLMMFKPSPALDRMGRSVKRAVDPDRVADHIADFSLAGLEIYRSASPSAPL